MSRGVRQGDTFSFSTSQSCDSAEEMLGRTDTLQAETFLQRMLLMKAQQASFRGTVKTLLSHI